jgi:hypothetical protein
MKEDVLDQVVDVRASPPYAAVSRRVNMPTLATRSYGYFRSSEGEYGIPLSRSAIETERFKRLENDELVARDKASLGHLLAA